MSDIEPLIAIPLLWVSLFFIPALAWYGYNRARERGFRAPGAVALVAIVWMFALALTAISSSVSGDSYYQYFISSLIILSITPAFTLLLRALPKRSARVYGERRVRVPFIFLGTVLFLIAFVQYSAFLYEWWIGAASLGASLWESLKEAPGAIFLVLAGIYTIRLGYRLKSSQTSAVLLPGHNEPIGALYLRSFREESQLFVYGKKKNTVRMRQISRQGSWPQ
jgi:hypothetical protein